MSKLKKTLKITLIILVCMGVLAGVAVLGVDWWVTGTAAEGMISVEVSAQLTDVDCILVLGCGVWDNGQPSHMLEDRLKRGIELYNAGASPKLLMSGDHGRVEYDEVNVMKRFAMDAGIPSEDIFMDHAGFSTYESMYRAKEVFGAKKIIIISQEYHLYRALYIARTLGLEAYGVNANYRNYQNQSAMDTREVLARCKDFVTCIFKPEPTYLGDPIDLSGSGDVTND